MKLLKKVEHKDSFQDLLLDRDTINVMENNKMRQIEWDIISKAKESAYRHCNFLVNYKINELSNK